MNKQAVHSFSYITAEASRATQAIYQLLLFLKGNQITKLGVNRKVGAPIIVLVKRGGICTILTNFS